MDNSLNTLHNIQNILKQETATVNLLEIASLFGILEEECKNNKEVLGKLNKLENILIESISKNILETKDKFVLLKELGSIESILLKSSKKNKQSQSNLEAAAKGVTAAIAARALIGAGPLGMLAAGVLGVASHIILENNDDPHLSNEDLLTITYYLSRFDHEDLFGLHVSSTKAFQALEDVLNVKANTIRGKRDYFDSIIPQEYRKSQRKGYPELKSTKAYQNIIEKYPYKEYDEKKLRNIVVNILQRYRENLKI